MTRTFSIRQVSKWILRNTVTTTDHLSPEIKLHLITARCPLWMGRPENCPYSDPYWAFYWPGGQVLSRFLIDNPSFVRNKSVLDIGCGCGASSIAALMGSPKSLLANDTDEVALVATALNCKQNLVSIPRTSSKDLLNLPIEFLEKYYGLPDVILLGDMFYDENFSERLSSWLIGLKHRKKETTVLIGDPGRGVLERVDSNFLVLMNVALPPYITKEHYGCVTGRVLSLA